MTLSESLAGDMRERNVPLDSPRLGGETDYISTLARLLNGLFMVRDWQNISRIVRGQPVNAVLFRGTLLGDAEQVYPQMTERFKTAGYTPLLERRNGVDMCIALQGTIAAAPVMTRPWVHGLLLLITILTTTISGAGFMGYFPNVVLRELQRGNWTYIGKTLAAGFPFAFTLLLILGVHEMGHYLAARRHGVIVTLPYFIPFPFIGILGTLGAVIFIRSPLTNRKALFDVGIAGPLAGFVVALIAFIIGLLSEQAMSRNMLFLNLFGTERIGMPILLNVVQDIFRPDMVDLARHVVRQPIALAAWFGMLLTVLNLLPIGQLDGGHIMYTLFGRASWTIALLAFGSMLVLGMTTFPSLIFFAFLVLLTGLRHPPPGNDITPLNPTRRAIGYATIALFFLIGTLTPFPL
ncbi:MAG TPA: site-2 protease family protein [Aggregatilineales bacterium]|nr:site-2 protease family protein [Anaerolineales bacterium]HRE46449.1 site-2 protease family protein [Aggregatilineales bacterium]